MRFQLEPGTDIAALAAWDDGAVAGVDGCRIAVRDRAAVAQQHGVLIMETGADGSYLTEVVIGEALPEALRGWQPVGSCGLPLPTGSLSVDGLEEVGHGVSSPLRQRSIEPGDYDVTVLTGDSDAALERAWEQELDDETRRRIEGGNTPLLLGCAALLAAPLLAVLWTPWSLLGTLLLVAAASWWGRRRSRDPEVRAAEERWEAMQRRFPGVVLMLQRREQPLPAQQRGGLVDLSR